MRHLDLQRRVATTTTHLLDLRGLPPSLRSLNICVSSSKVLLPDSLPGLRYLWV